MMNLTDNLYKTQWLDLVFKNRNKEYGAYALRLNNSATTIKAFVTANLIFVGAILGPYIVSKLNFDSPVTVVEPRKETPVKISHIKQIPIEIPKSTPPPSLKPKTEQPAPKTIKYTQMVVAPAAEVTEEPPTQIQIATSVVGSSNSEGELSTSNLPITTGSGNSNSGVASDENKIHDFVSIQKYPEFPGGQSAFAKYLSKNLRYPGTARENNIQGKIILSFVIEKNGQLSNIKVLRGIGGGCDEEAVRVLKKSPAWTPGVQNERSVRVAYTIPINFQMPN